MNNVILGKTNIKACKNGFGALPIQRISKHDAAYLLQKSYENGINFFDTARSYSDSEEKIGLALSSVRSQIFISTKTPALFAEDFFSDLTKSLQLLKTDYIDILQFHNPPFCPKPGGKDGLYDAMLKAKNEGKIRFIGITNHRLSVAKEAVLSGLYDTLQFPFSYLAGEQELSLVNLCRERQVGFIAMKALSGGLITNAAAAYAYMAKFDNVLPIWGIQKEKELDEFLSYQDNPPVFSAELDQVIRQDRLELCQDFCRGCGYCQPCPVGIEIQNCARMSLLLRRAPSSQFLTKEWQNKMALIEKCIHCRHCAYHCPYSLDTPSLLEKNYEDYKTFLG